VTPENKKVLNEILSLEGDCLDGSRCPMCPFKTQCLYEFLGSKGSYPSKIRRKQMALDAIVYLELLGESIEWRPKID
jgi:hypothetical protein